MKLCIYIFVLLSRLPVVVYDYKLLEHTRVYVYVWLFVCSGEAMNVVQ